MHVAEAVPVSALRKIKKKVKDLEDHKAGRREKEDYKREKALDPGGTR